MPSKVFRGEHKREDRDPADLRSWNKNGSLPSEQKQFMETVAGKLVLGYGFDERYAKLLEQHGAAGWIQIWTSDEDAVHEDTVSPVWGTPDMDSSLFQLRMPVVAVSKLRGETDPEAENI